MTHLLAMATFALALSASPGPVNVLAMASGLNHGVWRSLPYVLGATMGFTALLYVIGRVGGNFTEDYPFAVVTCQILGTVYIVYLAIKLMRSKADVDASEQVKPKFHQGVVLQWINPKAWIACLSGVAAFVTGEGVALLWVFCLVYFVICFVGVGFWAVMGASTQRLLNQPHHLNWLNRIMGTGLGLVAVYLFYQTL